MSKQYAVKTSKPKFKVGDQVKVVYPDMWFPTYQDMAEKLGLKKWVYDGPTPSVQVTYRIVGMAEHSCIPSYGIVYGIEDREGNSYLVEGKALEIVFNDSKQEASPNPAVVLGQLYNSKDEGEIDFSKLKAGGTVLVELNLYCPKIYWDSEEMKKGYVQLRNPHDDTNIYVSCSQIKKYIPQKSALEVAEEEFNKATAEFTAFLNVRGVEAHAKKAIDRYYQARKTLETLKDKK